MELSFGHCSNFKADARKLYVKYAKLWRTEKKDANLVKYNWVKKSMRKK